MSAQRRATSGSARSIHRLSPAKVQKSKPGMHADGGGRYLRVTIGPDRSIRRSWVFRYATNARERAQRHGRERQMGLGPLHTVSLAEARKRAEAARLLRLDGARPDRSESGFPRGSQKFGKMPA
jgi:Arm DNA-binding domain